MKPVTTMKRLVDWMHTRAHSGLPLVLVLALGASAFIAVVCSRSMPTAAAKRR
jgi:hypothetical protein